jgi:integrase
MTIRLDTKLGRKALKPAQNPHYQRLRRGLSLGLRVADDLTATWCARLYVNNAYEWTTFSDLREGFEFKEASEAAEKWATQIEGGVRGRDAHGKVATVETACREYVEKRLAEHAPGAHDADLAFRRRVYGFKHPTDPALRKRCQREFEANAIARVPLAKFKAIHLRKWRDDLVKAGVGKGTVNRNLTHLKAALNHAAAGESKLAGPLLGAEIAHVVGFEGASKRRDVYLDRAQRRRLLTAADGNVRDLIEAAALTGARPGELVSMHRSAFDHRTESVTFSGKTGARTVPLSPPAAALFTRLAKSKLPGAFLLTRDDGKRWAPSDWDELVRDAAAKAKLEGRVVLYSLRHSFITDALLGGMATLEVARLVGTSLPMIEKHYGHLVASRARESLAAVAML